MTYKVSDYYAPSHEGGICWNDPDIAFPWPFKNAEYYYVGEGCDDFRTSRTSKVRFAYDGHPLAALRICNLG